MTGAIKSLFGGGSKAAEQALEEQRATNAARDREAAAKEASERQKALNALAAIRAGARSQFMATTGGEQGVQTLG